MSHLDCVGFSVASNDAFSDLLMQIAGLATREEGPGGIRLRWDDESGAAFAMFLDERGAITCGKPTFKPDVTIAARPTTLMPDPRGCAFCAVQIVEVVEQGEMAYPLPMELDDWQLGPIDPATAPEAMYATAFAENLTVFADQAMFDAAQPTDTARLAAKSLIPSGMFATSGAPTEVSARALITGVVEQSRVATNTLTRVPFRQARVETYAMTIDIVAAHSAATMAPGNVVQGQFWIVGARARQ